MKSKTKCTISRHIDEALTRIINNAIIKSERKKKKVILEKYREGRFPPSNMYEKNMSRNAK